MPQPEPMSLALALQQARAARGLTQEELAERSGVSIRTISDIERGISRYPRRDTLNLLSNALDLTEEEAQTLRPARYTRAAHQGAAAAPGAPSDAAPLIGRADVLQSIRAALTDRRVRLVTLTGPGGIGKTRLALALAVDPRPDVADSVTFVDLAPVASDAYVPSALAHTLGVRERVGLPIEETLAAELAERSILLILDNFEHVLGARSTLRVLLQRCPNLRLLVTSRHPLEIAGERIIVVPPLASPDPRQAISPDVALSSPATALFIERAREAQSGFTITPASARTIARICARLSGIPLAIELAAAWSDRLSPQEILLQLAPTNGQSLLAILSRRNTAETTRQRSMRDAVTWSYRLLGGREQVLFRRLGVFAGGWSVEDAEAICGGEQEDETVALTELADHSLIIPAPAREGSTRFSMHTVIAAYALALLDERKERATLARRHAEYFTDLVVRLEQELTGAQQQQSLMRLLDEYENIRAALQWAREHREVDLGLRLSGALWWFWETRGYATEGREWVEGMLELAEQTSYTAQDESLARALYCATILAAGRHDFAQAERFGRAFLQKTDQPAKRGRALLTLGNVAKFRGDRTQADALYTEGLALLRELDDTRGVLVALNNLSTVLIERGDLDRAAPLIAESLALKRQIGDRRGIAVGMINLSEIQKLQGDMTTARHTLEDSLAIFQELEDRQGAAAALTNLGELAYAQGDDAAAVERFTASLALYQQMEDTTGEAQARQHLGKSLARVGDVRQAQDHLRLSATGFAALNQPADEVTSLVALANIAWATGERPLAAQALSDVRRRLDRSAGAHVTLSPATQAEYEQLEARMGDAERSANDATEQEGA